MVKSQLTKLSDKRWRLQTGKRTFYIHKMDHGFIASDATNEDDTAFWETCDSIEDMVKWIEEGLSDKITNLKAIKKRSSPVNYIPCSGQEFLNRFKEESSINSSIEEKYTCIPITPLYWEFKNKNVIAKIAIDREGYIPGVKLKCYIHRQLSSDSYSTYPLEGCKTISEVCEYLNNLYS